MKNYFKKMLADKQRYHQYKAEKQQLPSEYRQALDALEKYMYNFAGNNGFMEVLYQTLELFTESAANRVPVKQVIGNDPVIFANNLMAQYPDNLWFAKMQNNLRDKFNQI